MEILIEKNVPLPPLKKGITGMLESMEVGDSIVITRDQRASWYSMLKRLSPKRFTSRSVDELMVRLWRVE
jgi:hypothetical protein